jgi:hypothetical protein
LKARLRDAYVESKPLGKILPTNQIYSMAKIDVEGLELSVLKGARDFLKNSNPPVILLEINDSFQRYGYSENDIYEFLQQFGYIPAHYEGHSNRLSFGGRGWNDVLFISSKHKDIVTSRIQDSL